MRLALAVLALLAVLPAAAQADVVVPGAKGKRLDALDGALTWLQDGRLMRFADGQASAAPGLPGRARRRIGDLGLDAAGRVVLTLRTCRSRRCSWWLYDVRAGTAARLSGLRSAAGCRIDAVSVWLGSTAVARGCRRQRRSRLLVLQDGRVRRSITYRSIGRVRSLDLGPRWLAIGSDDRAGVHFVERLRGGCRGRARSSAPAGSHPQVVGDRLFWSVAGGFFNASLPAACRASVRGQLVTRREHSAVAGTTLYSITARGIEAATNP